MQGQYLKLYVPQAARHGGKLLYEWLLEEAHRAGIAGGSVFRAIASYGRDGRMHEEHFFELADDVPLAVEFFADATAIGALLERLQAERISLFYIRLPAEGGLSAG